MFKKGWLYLNTGNSFDSRTQAHRSLIKQSLPQYHLSVMSLYSCMCCVTDMVYYLCFFFNINTVQHGFFLLWHKLLFLYVVMQWSIILRIFRVETYIQKKSYEKWRNWVRSFSDPSKSIIHWLANKFQTASSLLIKE
jgi:hypothetical protein